MSVTTPFIDPAHNDEGIIIRTTGERSLDQIRFAHVQAVIYTPPKLPDWFADLAAAVRSGAFRVPRTLLDDVAFGEIEAWLEANLPDGAVEPDVRTALKHDVLSLVDRERLITGTSCFIFRALTGTPNRHCGFHVDTVPPGAMPWGLLRVYNGAGTDYVNPDNVTTMRSFYRYMSRRERLVRDLGDARVRGDTVAYDRLLNQIMCLDDERAFLKRLGKVSTAPAGCVVAFKHLDIRLHWSDHATGLAWIHCSPMAGEPRFLVNIMPRPPVVRRSVPRGTGGIAPGSMDLST